MIHRHRHRPRQRHATPACLVAALAAAGCGEGPVDPPPDGPAAPVIDLVTPGYQVVGDPDAWVTVLGTGYRHDSVLLWDGEALATVAQPTPVGTLTAPVPLAALGERHEVDLTVYTPVADSGVTSAPYRYRVEYAEPIVSSTDPVFAAVGSESVTFQAVGWGFVPETEVYLDSVAVASETIDFHTLRFTAPAALLSEPGERRIRVRNPGREGEGWSEGATLHVFHPVSVGGGGHQIGAGCLVDDHGGLVCWDTQPRTVAGHLRFRELHGGLNACAATPAGEVYCWGYNPYGQLGTGSWEQFARTAEPTVPVLGLADVSGLTVGSHHACALDQDDRAWCWGINEYGQLGTDEELGVCRSSVECAPAPVAVAGDLRFGHIAAGRAHTCALTTGGTAYCWGSDALGALGTGPEPHDSPVPQRVATELEFASLVTADDLTCALTAQGDAYCWGGESWLATPHWDAPTPVAEGIAFRTLSGGAGWCGITVDHAIYCWRGSDSAYREGGDRHWSEIRVRANGWSLCGLTTDRGFYCWGGWDATYTIEFPLVSAPEICATRGGGRPPIHCYPSPTLVFGVVAPPGGATTPGGSSNRSRF